MGQLFSSLTKLISPDLISKVGSILGEDSSKIGSAATASMAGLFGSLMGKGNDSKVESLLKEAGNINTDKFSDISGLLSGSSDEKVSEVSSGFLSSLLGDKLDNFKDSLSSFSGLSKDSANSVLSMVTSMFSGSMGNSFKSSGSNFSNFMSSVSSEKDSFLSSLPSNLKGAFSANGFLGDLKNTTSSVVNKISDTFDNAGDAVEEKVSKLKDYNSELQDKITEEIKEVKEDFNSGNYGWLKWALGLLVIGGLGWWAYTKFASPKIPDIVNNAKENIEGSINNASANFMNEVNSLKNKIKLTLPSGLNLEAYPGGIEEQLIKFLGSDEYKNATPEQLKGTWFNFDNINFKVGSGTELTEESLEQISNLENILKNYSGIKVKIGAYTDRTGDEDVNLKISQERANTIKDLLTKEGFGNQIVGAEGYGSQFAKVPAEASEEDRATDRRIAIRIEK